MNLRHLIFFLLRTLCLNLQSILIALFSILIYSILSSLYMWWSALYLMWDWWRHFPSMLSMSIHLNESNQIFSTILLLRSVSCFNLQCSEHYSLNKYLGLNLHGYLATLIKVFNIHTYEYSKKQFHFKILSISPQVMFLSPSYFLSSC